MSCIIFFIVNRKANLKGRLVDSSILIHFKDCRGDRERGKLKGKKFRHQKNGFRSNDARTRFTNKSYF